MAQDGGKLDIMLHEGQQEIIDSPARFKIVSSGRRWGKLLPIDTPIITPKGWSSIGELNLDDEIFDEEGQTCRVIGYQDDVPDKAYRLFFNDGTFLDSCEDHQWITWTCAERKAFLRSPYEDTSKIPRNWPGWRLSRWAKHAPRHLIEKAIRLHIIGCPIRKIADSMGFKWGALWYHAKAGRCLSLREGRNLGATGPQIRTTGQIVETLTYGKRCDANHCIPVCKPLSLPKAKFLIDPYIFGYWLGDGSTGIGYFTVHLDDQGNLKKRLLDARYKLGRVADKKMISALGLTAQLREIGVLGNKHVPKEYMRGSAEQRLELLQGLMDSDGYAAKSKIEFCSMKKGLAESVVELARTLGQKPVLLTGRATLYGVDHGKKYRVMWRPTINPFSLKRKADKLPDPKKRALQLYHRMIVNAKEIDPVPMRCIAVDSPNKMYLAGKAMIPTHNSETGVWWALERARRDRVTGVNPSIGWYVAPTYKVARPVWRKFLRLAPKGWITKISGTERAPDSMELGHVIIEFKTAEKPENLVAEGLRWVWIDEAAIISEQVWNESLRPALMDYGGPALFTSTPKGHNWFHKLYTRGKDPEYPSYASFGGPSFENPWLDEDELREVMRDMVPRLIKQEIFAEFLKADEGEVFTNVKEARLMAKMMFPKTGGYCSHPTFCIGVDLGFRIDFTVAYGVCRAGHPTGLRRFQKPWPATKDELAAISQQAGRPLMLVDQSGLGDPIVQDLEKMGLRVLGVQTGARKIQLIDALAIALNNLDILIPDDEDGEVMFNELISFGYEMTKAGNIRYSAPTGQHDDTVLAAALAAFGLLNSPPPVKLW